MQIINEDLLVLVGLSDVQLEELVTAIPPAISTCDGNTYIPLELMDLIPDSILSLETRLKLYSHELAKGIEVIENDDQVRDNIKLYFSIMPEYIQDMLLNTCNAEVMEIIG